MTAFDQKLAAIFQGEHADHLKHIRSILALLENVAETRGRTELDEAFRRAHSLKGAAQAVDLDTVEGLASGLETLFARVREGTITLDRQTIRVIHQTLDASEECVGAFRDNRVAEEPAAVLRAMDDLLGNKAREISPEKIAREKTAEPKAAEPKIVEPKVPEPKIAEKEIVAEPADLPARKPDAVPAAAATAQTADLVRLPAENLDRLLSSTGRILTESLLQANATEEFEVLDRQIAEVAAGCVRFRRASAAPLWRLANQREYAAVIQHIGFVEQKVRALAAQSSTALALQQRSAWNTQRSAEQLQRDVWSARMAPAEDLFEGFRKMVRDLAREENKELDFRLTGSGVRADRVVLQALKDPVMHLLRNAISHGIETPAERAAKGKPPVGSLTLHLDSQRGRLIVEVDDDGRGIDLQKVADVLSSAEPGVRSPEELTQAIFRPGFSTSDTVNYLSGRGMGLSVVYEAARRLQGDVTVRPKEGPGAAFLLSVPLSVSTCHLLLIKCAGQTFGIPTHAIARLYRVPLGQVESLAGKPALNLDGCLVPLYGLAHLLRIGDASPSLTEDILPVMVLKLGARLCAIWTDELLTERDAMIQELGLPLPPTGHISGGALLADGTVFVVLNPAGLVASCMVSAAAPPPQKGKPAVEAIAPGILVVDDSITSRSLERSILEAYGYRVRVAMDGLEALTLLRAEKADLIITDLQMPNMDGFQLLQALKADSQLNRIPVIIVSSLESAQDQERGLTLGANAYVVKRKFDRTELLGAIRQMI